MQLMIFQSQSIVHFCVKLIILCKEKREQNTNVRDTTAPCDVLKLVAESIQQPQNPKSFSIFNIKETKVRVLNWESEHPDMKDR